MVEKTNGQKGLPKDGAAGGVVTQEADGQDTTARGSIVSAYKWLRWILTGEDSGRWIQGPISQAKEYEMRVKTQRALVAIEKEPFYNLGSVVALMRGYYAKKRDETFEKLDDPDLSDDQRAKLRQEYEDLVKHTEKRLKGRRIARQLRRLMKEGADGVISPVPKGTRIKLVYDFLIESGFTNDQGILPQPAPLNFIEKQPVVAKNLVYRASGHGDMLFHAIRTATGQDDPARYQGTDPKPFDGAVYRSYVFDDPYLKRGVFVIRNGDLKGPVDVEYFEGWTTDMPTGPDGEPQVPPGQDVNVGHRYEEYYRGYLIDQGYDSYVFLVGPQDPLVKLENAREAFSALDVLIKEDDEDRKGHEQRMAEWAALVAAGRAGDDEKPTPEAGWNSKDEDLQTYLGRQRDATVTRKVEALVRRTYEEWREKNPGVAATQTTNLHRLNQPAQAPRPQAPVQGQPAGSNLPAPMQYYSNQSFIQQLLSDPLLQDDRFQGQSVVDEDEAKLAAYIKAKAESLKQTVWTLFEVDDKPKPQSGQNRRIRTVYLEGANRGDLTPNIIQGSILAFDSSGKNQMISERTIMYRLMGPSSDPIYMTRLTTAARAHAGRVDMRDPDHRTLEEFDTNYREIFTALGYNVGGRDDEPGYRMDRRTNDGLTSSADDVELVLEQ